VLKVRKKDSQKVFAMKVMDKKLFTNDRHIKAVSVKCECEKCCCLNICCRS
jgi:hypothetical protein